MAQAGKVFRVPAPEIETLIERFLRDRCRHNQGDLRTVVAAKVARITVHLDSISVELAVPDGTEANQPNQTRQIVSLPWSKRPVRSTKELAYGSSASGEGLLPAQAALAAIGKARRWVDALMAGETLADIAREEGKGERFIRMLIPLAFTSPAIGAEDCRRQCGLWLCHKADVRGTLDLAVILR